MGSLVVLVYLAGRFFLDRMIRMMLWFFLKSGWCRLSLLYFISLSHSLFLVHNLVFVYAVAKVLLALLLHPLLSFRCRGLIQIRPVVSVRLLWSRFVCC